MIISWLFGRIAKERKIEAWRPFMHFNAVKNFKRNRGETGETKRSSTLPYNLIFNIISPANIINTIFASYAIRSAFYLHRSIKALTSQQFASSSFYSRCHAMNRALSRHPFSCATHKDDSTGRHRRVACCCWNVAAAAAAAAVLVSEIGMWTLAARCDGEETPQLEYNVCIVRLLGIVWQQPWVSTQRQRPLSRCESARASSVCARTRIHPNVCEYHWLWRANITKSSSGVCASVYYYRRECAKWINHAWVCLCARKSTVRMVWVLCARVGTIILYGAYLRDGDTQTRATRI